MIEDSGVGVPRTAFVFDLDGTLVVERLQDPADLLKQLDEVGGRR
jgi:hypothetical protein